MREGRRTEEPRVDLNIGILRTGQVDMAPAVNVSDATHPCAHTHVDEEALGVASLVNRPERCRRLTTQPCQPSNRRQPRQWPMRPSPRHAGNQSGFLVQSIRPRLESHSQQAGQPAILSSLPRPPMPGRPPSPSLAPPRSLRTRLFRQGAKNFCCAKLGPCRVFA